MKRNEIIIYLKQLWKNQSYEVNQLEHQLVKANFDMQRAKKEAQWLKDEAQEEKEETQRTLDRMHARQERDRMRTNGAMEEMLRLWQVSNPPSNTSKIGEHNNGQPPIGPTLDMPEVHTEEKQEWEDGKNRKYGLDDVSTKKTGKKRKKGEVSGIS